MSRLIRETKKTTQRKIDMEQTLKDIQKTAQIWRESERLETLLRRRWQDFIFHGRRESWYDDFVILKLSEGFSHRYFSRPMRDKTTPISGPVSVVTGSKLLDELKEIEALHVDAEKRLSELLEVAWIDDELPLADIALAYGATPDATHKYISRQDWFTTRHATKKVAG